MLEMLAKLLFFEMPAAGGYSELKGLTHTHQQRGNYKVWNATQIQCVLESVLEKALPRTWQNKQTKTQRLRLVEGGAGWQIPEKTAFFSDFSEMNDVWLETECFDSSSLNFKTWNEMEKGLQWWHTFLLNWSEDGSGCAWGTWDTLTSPQDALVWLIQLTDINTVCKYLYKV